MNPDERWLRDTLDLDVVPPPDLADRAERTARRAVRRRVAAGALAVAAVVAVPLAVQGGRGPDRTAGPTPAAGATASPASCPDRPARPLRPARTAADVAWPYRGDPALRPAAVAAGTCLTYLLPLFGARLDRGRSIFVLVGRDAAGRWELRWRTGGGGGSGSSPVDALGPDTMLDLTMLTSPATADLAGRLVVLAPPGTTEIAYTTCPGSRRYAAPGGTAVIPLPPRELRGAIEIRTAAGAVVALGPVGSYLGGAGAYPVDPPPVPAGYREVFGVTGDGSGLTWGGPDTLRDARVLVRCKGSTGATVTPAVGRPPARVRCDGQFRVGADGVTLRPGARLVDRPRPVLLDVLVVVPDR